MFNVEIVNGVSPLEIGENVIEAKDISEFRGACQAHTTYELTLTPLLKEHANHSFFTVIIMFSIRKNYNDSETILFKLKGGLTFQLRNFHVYTNISDLEDCIFETYNQTLLHIEKNYSKIIKETPFPLLTSEELYPHILKRIHMVYPHYDPKLGYK